MNEISPTAEIAENPTQSLMRVKTEMDFDRLAQLSGFLSQTKSERFQAVVLEHNAPKFIVGIVNLADTDHRNGVIRALNSSPFHVRFERLGAETYDRIRAYIYKPEMQAEQDRQARVGNTQQTKSWGADANDGSGAPPPTNSLVIVPAAEKQRRSTGDGEDSAEHTSEADEWIDLTDTAEYERNLRRNENDLQIQEFIRLMLTEFLRSGASDLHVLTGNPFGRIRFRLDGELYTRWNQVPFDFVKRIVMGLAEMSGKDASLMKFKDLDSTIKVRFPRDGVPVDVELRFNSQPTLYAPTVVLRSQLKPIRDLHQVGFNERQIADIEAAYLQPRGIIAITGATGSGKTNTLESIYARLEEPDIFKIIEISEPIEIRSEWRTQISLTPKSPFTWWDSLHSSLRADPDIIGLGELRSADHASVAINAALTGHLVLSTFHASSVEDTLTRLFQMGIPRDNLATGLNLVLAQRLVKTLCECKRIDDERSAVYGAPVYKAVGCPVCFNKGVRGRTAIAETLLINEEVQDLIQNLNLSARDVVKKAMEAGFMIPMKVIAREKILAGVTTELEVSGSLGLALSELAHATPEAVYVEQAARAAGAPDDDEFALDVIDAEYTLLDAE